MLNSGATDTNETGAITIRDNGLVSVYWELRHEVIEVVFSNRPTLRKAY